MQSQGALADPTLAGAHGHEMAHPGKPVGDAAALLGDLLEDSGPSVADDVLVALHLPRHFRGSIAYIVPHPPRRIVSRAVTFSYSLEPSEAIPAGPAGALHVVAFNSTGTFVLMKA